MDLPLGRDPEGEGEAVATLVRYRPDSAPADWQTRPAMVWVHGMTDYFFQDHVARAFHERGYAFYGLDLRKCGRARQEGQHWHYSSDLRHYFADLDAALRVLRDTGHDEIIPIAHSTGGLIVPLWLDHLRGSYPRQHAAVTGLILNSPWLDMMYPRWFIRLIRPLVMVLGRRTPHLLVPGGGLGNYGQSIHSSKHGEWDFDLDYKPIGGHDKYLGWLRAILLGHREVHQGEIDIGVPALTLCSTRSYLGKPHSAASNTADTVLDVEQIQKWAPLLGDDVTVHPIDGARHDVFLSLQHAREEALSVSEEWLASLPTSRE